MMAVPARPKPWPASPVFVLCREGLVPMVTLDLMSNGRRGDTMRLSESSRRLFLSNNGRCRPAAPDVLAAPVAAKPRIKASRPKELSQPARQNFGIKPPSEGERKCGVPSKFQYFPKGAVWSEGEISATGLVAPCNTGRFSPHSSRWPYLMDGSWAGRPIDETAEPEQDRRHSSPVNVDCPLGVAPHPVSPRLSKAPEPAFTFGPYNILGR